MGGILQKLEASATEADLRCIHLNAYHTISRIYLLIGLSLILCSHKNSESGRIPRDKSTRNRRASSTLQPRSNYIIIQCTLASQGYYQQARWVGYHPISPV